MRLTALLFALALTVSPAASPQTAKPPAPKAQGSTGEKLPPLSYVCPMPQDADVIEDKPGKCPKCGMTLTPIRLDTIWSCPVHSAVHETKAGKCPIDGRELIQVIVAISWTCPGATTEFTEPGSCPDGSARAKKYAARPHGNHNPQHGGQFFMAADNWHHLEGAYPRAGLFRLYLYDDYTKPLKLADFKAITGRVVSQQTFDPTTLTTKESAAFQLVPARGGRYLEAKVGASTLPAQLTAKVRFKPDTPESSFDFTFATYSKEPVAGAAPTLTSAAPASAPMAAAASPGAPGGSGSDVSSGVDPALVPLPIPDTIPEMLAQLRTRTDQIRTFIDNGSFAAIYVPAFQAKDLALALDAHANELSFERRKIAEPAIVKLVRTAYLLDAFGDLGNKQQISEAYTKFLEAARDIQSSFPQQP
jgi:Heavy metal binding domain